MNFNFYLFNNSIITVIPLCGFSIFKFYNNYYINNKDYLNLLTSLNKLQINNKQIEEVNGKIFTEYIQANKKDNKYK